MDLLRKITFPISLIYALVVHLRNVLYDIGVFKSKSFKTPTICVGNLSVGGTGKTPMIEFLIRFLSKEFEVAVLSRGYKRKSSGFVLATSTSDVAELGDEPFQIHSKFPKVHVAVDADRRNGISRLEERVSPDVILLDDAFQHRKIKPTSSILLTSYSNLYPDDMYLPTGSLRDGRNQAKRANVIVVTKCPPRLSEAEQKEITKKLEPRPQQMVLFSFLKYDDILSPDNTIVTPNSLMDKDITLVTGIADPDPLIYHLKSNGLSFQHLRFKDHHFFTDGEIKELSVRELILTTEKDHVRLMGKVSNLYRIGVRHSFLNDGGVLLKREVLDSIMQGH